MVERVCVAFRNAVWRGREVSLATVPRVLRLALVTGVALAGAPRLAAGGAAPVGAVTEHSVKWDTDSPCLAHAERLQTDSSQFTGFGAGGSAEAALDAARADLVKQIRVRVSTRSEVRETGGESATASRIVVRAAEALSEVAVARRCAGHAGRPHEAVVTLPRAALVKGLEARLDALRERFQSLAIELANANALIPANESARLASLRLGREALLEAPSFADDLLLCRTLGGCARFLSTAVEVLRREVERASGAGQFPFQCTNGAACALKGALVDLLAADGIVATDGEGDKGKVARAECRDQVFPRLAGMAFLVVEVTCRVQGMVAGRLVFSHTYVGRATDTDAAAALVTARGNLRREEQQKNP